MAYQPQQPEPTPGSGNWKLRQRRSKKACHECHARKIRCDVSQRGVPCSNCIELPAACAIRRRKNQRADATPTDEQEQKFPPFDSPGHQDAPAAAPGPNGTPAGYNGWRTQGHPEHSPVNTVNNLPAAPPLEQPPHGMSEEWHAAATGDSEGPMTSSSIGADFDLSTLAEIEGLFSSTEVALIPTMQQPFSLPPLEIDDGRQLPNPASLLSGENLNFEDKTMDLGLTGRDRTYLQSEGCFDLPYRPAFRIMMEGYFKSIHSNLPIVNETSFWALWHGDKFDLGTFSCLVVQAMVFAAVGLIEEKVAHDLGFADKRKARTAYYRKAKLLFDFGVERDPYYNAQACLLLTYWAPNHNNSRINSFWLMNAIRFARLAKAETFMRISDPVMAMPLKRLWWCVLLRDRILSLGLRRPMQVDQDIPPESGVLTTADFQSEIGQSIVHDPDTQMQIFKVISTLCKLVLAVTPTLRILYTIESVEDRTKKAGESLYQTSEDLKAALNPLRHWNANASRVFPSPISLDDTPDAICVFANMLWVYYDAAVAALYSHSILLAQVYPARTALFPLEKSREAIENAMNDTTQRTAELVQLRLVKHLPISAAAYLSLPLILQAVNICAARNTGREPIEARKLDIFTKTLRSQQSSFDGADFCRDLLQNIIAYAEEDDQFSAKKGYNDGGAENSAMHSTAHSSVPSEDGDGSSPVKRKLTWEQILHRRPRLYLRLIFYLDIALCTGNAPKESDFPPVLQRGGAVELAPGAMLR